MSVYVGEEFCTLGRPHWPYSFAAHLFADSIEELDDFAVSIGLRREWFQDHPRLPHYDVTANKRREAIAKGAIPLDRKEEVKFYLGSGNYQCIESQANLGWAYDFFLTAWMGRNGDIGTTKGWNRQGAFCVRMTSGGGHSATRISGAVDSIPSWRRRLRGVTILLRDGFELLERIEDEARAVLYIDPPYIVKGANYEYDFKPEDHDRLAELLHRFKKARVVLSYYEHPKLRELYPDWWREEIEVSKALAHQGRRGENDVKATEILLCNQPIEVKERALFD